ncbi:MAG: signal peptidase I [Ruminococcus sp.]|nr:signal peptidase I [Ruminococcus sp.]MDY3894991.1 signal peptidase I [Candidatus Fimenecus sp.]
MRKVEQFEVDYRELRRTSSASVKRIKASFDWLDSIIYALLAIFILFTFLFRLVGVSGQSMEPTLHNGDWLAVRAVNTKINRGDIVVVTQPNRLNEPIIKRVIAVAGDTVDINFFTGEVTVNGVVTDEPYIAEKTVRSFDTSFPLTVPQNCVFVMGDNRNHSLDSRSSVIGFIDTRYILGVAEFRLIPVGDWKIDSNGK